MENIEKTVKIVNKAQVLDNQYCTIYKGEVAFYRVDKILKTAHYQDSYFNENGILITFKK